MHQVDVSNVKILPPQVDYLHMGTNVDAKGNKIEANSKYLLKNGTPWIPVMGEMHYSRYPRAEWETEILKMKAGGIEVIATYIFWIHHEEEQGKWTWEENRDLRYFVSLCAKHHMLTFPRLGPWCHGEVRNGGHPDWLQKGNIFKRLKLRRNSPEYMRYTRELYKQIHGQLKGYYWKEGGPVIAVQLENERTFDNPAGLEYMLELKKMARDVGIDVPLYVATGWQGYDPDQRELIPMWGAYPDAPWDSRLTELIENKRAFHFNPYIHDSDIGNDLLPQHPRMGTIDQYPFPYLTVEMGAGTQCTHHRRPIFNMYDGASLIQAKIGSGANGIGYYVFHGGSNPIGKLSPLQESKATHYPNDLPIISYDFYTALSEWGQMRPSYHKLKSIHFFLHEWGHLLAPYITIYPEDTPKNIMDRHTLRWVVRTDGTRGFLFINNYQRHIEMDNIQNVQFQVQLQNQQQITFPETPISIPNKTIAIFPFNLSLGNLDLISATVQPFTILNAQNETMKTLVMGAIEGIPVGLQIGFQNIKNITGKGVEIIKTEKSYRISAPEPGRHINLTIQYLDGTKWQIIILNHEEILKAWKISLQNQDYLIISDAEIFSDGTSIKLRSTSQSRVDMAIYPKGASLKCIGEANISINDGGVFECYAIAFYIKKIDLKWQEEPTIANELISSQAPKHPSRFSPIQCYPIYDTVLSRVTGARYWKIHIPQDIFAGVSDIFLKIKYEGDTQAVYLNGKLVADDFFNGDPMTIGLNRFRSTIQGNDLVLLVTPLEDLGKVYMEKHVKQRFKTSELKATIKSIEVLPQYEALFEVG